VGHERPEVAECALKKATNSGGQCQKSVAAECPMLSFFLSRSRIPASNSRFDETNFFPVGCVHSGWGFIRKNVKMRSMEQSRNPVRRKPEIRVQCCGLNESE